MMSYESNHRKLKSGRQENHNLNDSLDFIVRPCLIKTNKTKIAYISTITFCSSLNLSLAESKYTSFKCYLIFLTS